MTFQDRNWSCESAIQTGPRNRVGDRLTRVDRDLVKAPTQSRRGRHVGRSQAILEVALHQEPGLLGVTILDGSHQVAVFLQRLSKTTRLEQRVVPVELHDFAQIQNDLQAPGVACLSQ